LEPVSRTETTSVAPYAWDLPEEGDAHAEVRLLRPEGQAGDDSYEPGRTAWTLIRES